MRWRHTIDRLGPALLGRREHLSRSRAWVLAATFALALVGALVLKQGLWRLDGLLARRAVFGSFANDAFRPIEARLSYPAAVAHRPPGAPGRIPNGEVRVLSMEALGRLERGRDPHGVAAANLLAGEVAQARARLDLLLEDPGARTPAVVNDRAAVALAEGDVASALALTDEVLDADARHPQALFNRALALRTLRLSLTAQEMFERVAALGEPGWAAEARDQAERLQADSARRLERWREGRNVRDALGASGALPPEATIQRHPEWVHAGFFDALWTAQQPEAVLRLMPLARTLDAHFGTQSLTRLAARVARADFGKRRPLATRYAGYIQGKVRGDELVAFALTHEQEPDAQDLVLGALAATGLVKDHLDVFARLSAPLADPWLETVEQEGRWSNAYGAGRYEEAAQVAAQAMLRCQRVPLFRRCVTFETRLAQALSRQFRLTEAGSHLGHARESAIAGGMMRQESVLLAAIAKLETDRFRTPLARAFMEEVARNPESRCQDRADAHQRLAEHALWHGRPTEAAAEIRRVPPCPRQETLTPRGVDVATALRRLDRSLVMPAQVEAAIAALPEQGGPEYQGFALLASGRWRLLDDPAQGTRLLEQALAAAQAMNPVERPFVESEAREALAFEAARQGRWADSLEQLRAAAGVGAGRGCTLALAADVGRELVIAQGPSGGAGQVGDISGRGAARTGGLDFDRPEARAPEIPGAVLDRLRGCQQVAVIAPARQRRWARVLPPEMAWSYAAKPPSGGTPAEPSPAASSPGIRSRLVVSDPRPPASLVLSRLSPVELPPGPGLIALRGPEATPAAVLARLPEADLAELHVHGIVDADVSQETALVLSPDASGDFLLSRTDLQGVKLPRRPIVVLAACQAAGLATRRPDASELASAFIAAGGRAVVASTGSIPDGQGQAFFTRLRAELERGTPVGAALRNVRTSWPRSGARSWIDEVVVYE